MFYNGTPDVTSELLCSCREDGCAGTDLSQLLDWVRTVGGGGGGAPGGPLVFFFFNLFDGEPPATSVFFF